MPRLSTSAPASAQENMDSAGDPVPPGCLLKQLKARGYWPLETTAMVAFVKEENCRLPAS